MSVDFDRKQTLRNISSSINSILDSVNPSPKDVVSYPLPLEAGEDFIPSQTFDHPNITSISNLQVGMDLIRRRARPDECFLTVIIEGRSTRPNRRTRFIHILSMDETAGVIRDFYINSGERLRLLKDDPEVLDDKESPDIKRQAAESELLRMKKWVDYITLHPEIRPTSRS